MKSLRSLLAVCSLLAGTLVLLSVPAGASPKGPEDLGPGSGWLEPGETKCVTDPDRGTICGTFPKSSQKTTFVRFQSTSIRGNSPKMRPTGNLQLRRSHR